MDKQMSKIAKELVNDRVKQGGDVMDMALVFDLYPADVEYAQKELNKTLSWEEKVTLAKLCRKEALQLV